MQAFPTFGKCKPLKRLPLGAGALLKGGEGPRSETRPYWKESAFGPGSILLGFCLGRQRSQALVGKGKPEAHAWVVGGNGWRVAVPRKLR